MDGRTYDVFRGATEKDAVWLEAVPGFLNALQRIKEIAGKKPGQYFVYEARSCSTIVQIDTRKPLLTTSEQKAKIA
jgi:hypothetical protein